MFDRGAFPRYDFLIVKKGGVRMKLTVVCDKEAGIREIPSGGRLSDLLREAGYSVPMPCGGCGRCGKCRVRAEGRISPVTVQERLLLTAEELASGVRLACETEVLGDAAVFLPKASKFEAISAGILPDFVPDGGAGLGLAVDIGTTTLAAYLWDLGEGRLLSSGTAPNPQAAFGADVMTRLGASRDGHASDLAKAVRTAICALADRIGEEAGLRERVDFPGKTIKKAVFVGNTAMLCLLTEGNASKLCASPFLPESLFGETAPAASLGLTGLLREAEVYLGRCVSAFVGADITAAMLASRLDEAKRPALLMDIGTNGEMALAGEGKLRVCSTAAGPAFEGAGIYCGTQAVPGAVSGVVFREGGFSVRTVAGAAPCGLCGSGLIDAAAAMLAAGILDETGRIDGERAASLGVLTEAEGVPAVVLKDKIVLTQKDLRSFQLAKAAVCAGAETLLHHAGLRAEDLSEILLAGGFGSFLPVGSASATGLLPAGCEKKARAVGNAAGSGASMMLLSAEERRRAEEIASAAATIDLSSDAFFMDRYVEDMLFG